MFNLPDIHKLIDEQHDAIGIALHESVAALARFVGVGIDQLLQRVHYQSHRRAQFMRHVREELQFLLAVSFRLDMLEHLVSEDTAIADLNNNIVSYSRDDEYQEQYRPPALPPCWSYENADFRDIAFYRAIGNLCAERVRSWRQAAERYCADAFAQGYPSLVVHRVVDDLFVRVAQVIRTDFDCKGIVVVSE